MKRFVRFPFTLYKDDRNWVPPLIRSELETLNSGKNPAFDHCEALMLLAYKDGKPAGRIVGIINERFLEKWKCKDARFCWFESIDDREVSGALYDRVEEWALSRGMERLVGPMGFTTFERQGMLVEGFEEMPTFSGCYNPAYYPEHMKAMGYGKETAYVEYELTVPESVPPKILRINEVIKERYGLRIPRAKTTRELLPYARGLFEVINLSYSPLYGFTELTDRQIDYFVKKYFGVVRPDFVSVVLNRDDQVVGFQISVPSLTKALRKARGSIFPFGWWHLRKAFKHPDRIDTLLTGVRPEYQRKGANSIFMVHLTQAAIDNGVSHAESNGELADNIKVQNTWRYFERRQHRQSWIFARTIG
jgi:GNAT superfamily N-acetyltransferase